jgi:hypothetical protein
MASLQKRNGSYRVRIKRVGQNTLSKTFYNRLEAVQWAKQTEAELRLGLYVEPDGPAKPSSEVLFERAATHYMNTHSIHKKIVRCETSRLRILIKRWGHLPVEQVNKLAVLALRDDLLKLGRSGETINHYFNTISNDQTKDSGRYISPESIVFVPAASNPSSKNLLVVGYEGTGRSLSLKLIS